MKLLSWAMCVLGIWVLLTPWITANNIIDVDWVSIVCGLVIAILGLVSALTAEKS